MVYENTKGGRVKDVASAYVLRPLQQYELSFNLEEQDKSEQKDT